jgi:hypothetical protein
VDLGKRFGKLGSRTLYWMDSQGNGSNSKEFMSRREITCYKRALYI